MFNQKPLGGGGLFGQPAQTQQQPSLFGQPLQQTTNQPLLFGQQPQQQQQQQIFGAQPNLFNQQPTQQMNLQQNPINQANIPEANIERIQEKQKKFLETSSYLEKLPQDQRQQALNPFLQNCNQSLQMNTNDTINNFKTLLAKQRDLVRSLDYYVSSLGIIEKLSIDGIEAVKKEDALHSELQQAQQTIKQCYDKIQNGRNAMYEHFYLPQKYQEQMIVNQVENYKQLSQAIEKMVQYYHRQPNMNVDELLQNKIVQLQTLANYAYMIQLRIRNIDERVNTLKTKNFQRIFPEKIIGDFHSIDTSKKELEVIIQQPI